MGAGGDGRPAAPDLPAAQLRQLEPHKLPRVLPERWVKVGAWEYDVTGFKHPGGNVINYMLANTGADATDAFREFHSRSKKAQVVLRSLPRRQPCLAEPYPREEQAMLDAFAQFRRGLEAEGFFAPSALHLAWRVAEVGLIFALGTLLLARGHLLLGVLALGLFGGRCGWLQHEGGHNSLTGDVWWDKRIQAAAIGLGLGTSGSMWNGMHNKHHSTPQKIKYDMDLDTTPLVAFFDTAVESNRVRGYSRKWLRFQAWTFLPVTSGALVMLFWLLFLHPRHALRTGNWEEGLWMLSSHVLRTAAIKIACPGLGLAACYGLLWASFWISGMYLFGHFSLSHTHTGTVPADAHISWVRYAVDHTVDIDPHRGWVNWVMGYLNCQVVHHLFPNMPQFHQPEVSRRFAAFAREWDLDYKVISYPEAWRRTFSNLNDVGKVYIAKQKRAGRAKKER